MFRTGLRSDNQGATVSQFGVVLPLKSSKLASSARTLQHCDPRKSQPRGLALHLVHVLLRRLHGLRSRGMTAYSILATSGSNLIGIANPWCLLAHGTQSTTLPGHGLKRKAPPGTNTPNIPQTPQKQESNSRPPPKWPMARPAPASDITLRNQPLRQTDR